MRFSRTRHLSPIPHRTDCDPPTPLWVTLPCLRWHPAESVACSGLDSVPGDLPFPVLLPTLQLSHPGVPSGSCNRGARNRFSSLNIMFTEKNRHDLPVMIPRCVSKRIINTSMLLESLHNEPKLFGAPWQTIPYIIISHILLRSGRAQMGVGFQGFTRTIRWVSRSLHSRRV